MEKGCSKSGLKLANLIQVKDLPAKLKGFKSKTGFLTSKYEEYVDR